MTDKITEDQVIHWLGHDWQFSQIVEIIQDLANGDYSVVNMVGDIQESWKESTE
jgi:hypothetical protein|tara:strand:+ start:384 stop:545 length:162 start_codon:yes stop_codon:yes gene_type:complete